MSETIEQKTFRIFTAVFGDREETLEDSMSDPDFRITCKAAAMAIAEEREACAKIFDGFPDAEGLCGTVTSASAAKAIRARGAAPKDEVIE